MKVTDRKCTQFVQIHFELEYWVYEKLVKYCSETGIRKRKILQDAISTWLNDRELEEKRMK